MMLYFCILLLVKRENCKYMCIIHLSLIKTCIIRLSLIKKKKVKFNESLRHKKNEYTNLLHKNKRNKKDNLSVNYSKKEQLGDEEVTNNPPFVPSRTCLQFQAIELFYAFKPNERCPRFLLKNPPTRVALQIPVATFRLRGLCIGTSPSQKDQVLS